MPETLRTIVVCALLLACTVFAFYKPVEIEDNWWHLASGRWIMEHKSVPHNDPFPSFPEAKPWILTQWLGSVFFYGIYTIGGIEGLKIIRLCIFLLIIGMYFIYARRKIPISFLAVIILLMESGFAGRVLLRPDIFNYIFIQLFFIILLFYRKTQKRSVLYILPALGVLWGNLHLGSFVYGYLLIALFLSAFIVQWIILKAERRDEQESKILIRSIRDMAILFLVYGLAFFVSPYGSEAGLYPYKVFLLPDFIHLYKFVNIVGEANPPAYLFSWKGFWFFALSAAALTALLCNQKDRLLHIFLFVFPLFFFLRGSRAVGFFIIAAVYIIAECAAQCRFSERFRTFRHARSVDAFLTTILLFVLSFQIIHGLTERVYADGRFSKMYALGVDPRLPTQAVRFLKDNNINGLVFANDVLGGFLIWSAYPQLRPFVDARNVINPDLSFKQMRVMNKPQMYWPRLAEEFQFKIILLDLSWPSSSRFIEYISRAPDWQLVFMKGVDVIFVKRGAFPLKEDIDLFQDRLRNKKVDDEDLNSLSKASSLPPRGWRKELFFPKPQYSEVLEEAYTLFDLGFEGAAVKKLIQAYRVSDDKEVRSTMAKAYALLREEKL